MKKIFVFDIEETLLTAISPTRQPYVNQVPREPSRYNPYHPRQENVPHSTRSMCYTINREKTAEIMKAILANGDEIAFITTGGFPKDRIYIFFQTEYGINLPADFLFYNRAVYKTESLKKIAESRRIAYENVVLIDNAKPHIEYALNLGFSVIPVDTNNIPDKPVYGVDTTNVSVATSVGILHIQ
ncbi:hypothetical protein [Piscirickettsia salmonis]|uniref:hypothetical protein n=1 Tax=Piscirickettsia salmonis TaxID=1238 RepID=UPI003A80FDB5